MCHRLMVSFFFLWLSLVSAVLFKAPIYIVSKGAVVDFYLEVIPPSNVVASGFVSFGWNCSLLPSNTAVVLNAGGNFLAPGSALTFEGGRMIGWGFNGVLITLVGNNATSSKSLCAAPLLMSITFSGDRRRDEEPTTCGFVSGLTKQV